MASCRPLREPRASPSLEALLDGLKAEIMVAMLDAFNGTAATCAEICLRRLQAVHAELEVAPKEEDGTPTTGATYFLMSRDDEDTQESQPPVEQQQQRRDVHAWYEAKDDTAVLGPNGLALSAEHAGLCRVHRGPTEDLAQEALPDKPLHAAREACAPEAEDTATDLVASGGTPELKRPKACTAEAEEHATDVAASGPAPEPRRPEAEQLSTNGADCCATTEAARAEPRTAIPEACTAEAEEHVADVAAPSPTSEPRRPEAWSAEEELAPTGAARSVATEAAGAEAEAARPEACVAEAEELVENGSTCCTPTEAAGGETEAARPEACTAEAEEHASDVAVPGPTPEPRRPEVPPDELTEAEELAADFGVNWAPAETREPKEVGSCQDDRLPCRLQCPTSGGGTSGCSSNCIDSARADEDETSGAREEGSCQDRLPCPLQCPTSGGGASPPASSPGGQGRQEQAGSSGGQGAEEAVPSGKTPGGGQKNGRSSGEGKGEERDGGPGEDPVASEVPPPPSNEPVMDIIVPDGCTYQGERLPDGCTVAEWKSLLENGSIDGSKVLYARKLVCHAGRDRRKLLDNEAKLPLRPEAVAVSGPGAVMQMLELALRKRLGKPLPPPIEAAEGRAFSCASGSCRLMVHSDAAYGNYCCNLCLESDGRGHGEDCEQRQAPRHAPKGKPQSKYRAVSLTTDDLLKKEATFKPLTGEAKKKAYEMVKARWNFVGPYCDGDTMSALDCKKRLAMHNATNAWTLDYDMSFYCELLYEGVFPMGYEVPFLDGPIQMLLFCYDPKLSVWDFHETHVSRRVRKHAKSYSMTIDKAFDDVILGCVRQHGEAWLYRGLRWMLRRLFKEGYKGKKNMHFGIHTFELWDEEQKLVAGDLGCTIGGVYMSFSGFRMKDTKSCGEVQMVLTAGLLSKMGFDWMDLGQVLKYKERMGAKVIPRKEYYARLCRDRDKATVFSHERISGQELLQQILQAVADGPKPMPQSEPDEYRVVAAKVAVREKPSLEAHIRAILYHDAEIQGTAHDVGGLSWLRLESGWVLMDGETLGAGLLVAPKHDKVDYGPDPADVASLSPDAVDIELGLQPQAEGEEDAAQEKPAEEEPENAATPAPEDPAEDQGQNMTRAEKRAEEKKAAEVKRRAAEEEKKKKQAEKEAAARQKAAERVARLQAREEEAARHRQAAEEAEQRALERRENPEAFRPKSLKERKRWRREEEALKKKEEAELAKQRAAEEELKKQQAAEELKKKRAEEAEAAKKKAEEQAAQRKVAEAEAVKKRAEDEAIVRAMILTITEGAAPGPQQPKTLPKAKVKALAAKCQPTMDDQDLEDDGRLWVVTGGEGKGGILVRAGESMGSRQLPTRLLTGTTVEELEIAGNRLHYKRIRGDGPDWGWVSIMLSGKLLVEPLPS